MKREYTSNHSCPTVGASDEVQLRLIEELRRARANAVLSASGRSFSPLLRIVKESVDLCNGDGGRQLFFSPKAIQ